MGACIKLLVKRESEVNYNFLRLEKRKRPKRKVENQLKGW